MVDGLALWNLRGGEGCPTGITAQSLYAGNGMDGRFRAGGLHGWAARHPDAGQAYRELSDLGGIIGQESERGGSFGDLDSYVQRQRNVSDDELRRMAYVIEMIP